MKKWIPIAVVAANLALLGGLYWQDAERESDLRMMLRTAGRADELYLPILERSLSTIESGKPDEAAETAAILRTMIENMNRNIEARRAAGWFK